MLGQPVVRTLPPLVGVQASAREGWREHWFLAAWLAGCGQAAQTVATLKHIGLASILVDQNRALQPRYQNLAILQDDFHRQFLESASEEWYTILYQIKD